MENLKEKAIKGVGWSATEKWVQQAINFLTLLVLARILGPEDFGLVALASIFTLFVRMFLDQGMISALVQRNEIENKHLNSAFWVIVLMGSLLTFGGIVLSGSVAKFFHEPRLEPIVAWLSLDFIISSLSITQEGILVRKMDFKSLAIRGITSKIAGGSVGVTMALLGFGVWSLVAKSLITAVSNAALIWLLCDWRPALSFSKRHFKELYAFGINMQGLRILIFITLRIDHFIIGYFLGATTLGYYTIAFQIIRTIINSVSGLAYRVIFVSFARLQNDVERLRNALYKVIQLANLVLWPVFIMMAALSTELVTGFLSAKWLPSIPIIRIIAFAGPLLSIFFINRVVINAYGKPFWSLMLELVIVIVKTLVFLLIIKWGLNAVAVALVVITYGFSSPLSLGLVHRAIKINLKKYFGYYFAPVAGSLLMGAVILLLKFVLEGLPGFYLHFITYIVIGASVYLMTVRFMEPAIFRQMTDIIRGFSPRLKMVK